MTYTGRVKIADIAPNHPFARPSILIGVKKPNNGEDYSYSTDLRRIEAGTEAATGRASAEGRVSDLQAEGELDD
jgi:hypothetical protein